MHGLRGCASRADSTLGHIVRLTIEVNDDLLVRDSIRNSKASTIGNIIQQLDGCLCTCLAGVDGILQSLVTGIADLGNISLLLNSPCAVIFNDFITFCAKLCGNG